MMTESNTLEALLRRDRRLVILLLALIISTSWVYLLAGAGMGMSALDMSSLRMALGLTREMPVALPMTEVMAIGKPEAMETIVATMATPASWSLGYALLMFCMWWVMMIAMMLPSAAPMILLHARVYRSDKARIGESGLLSTTTFTLGYLLAWGLFSAVAAALQWAFERTGLLSPMLMNSTSILFAGIILLFAGAYQLTPIKQACLRHCRGPIQFLSQHWQPGVNGALRMGLHHGSYCLGCCWGLMALLFFGGIMNLYWIVGLAFIVLLEKMLPFGHSLSTVTGGLLLIWGASFVYLGVA